MGDVVLRRFVEPHWIVAECCEVVARRLIDQQGGQILGTHTGLELDL